MFLCHMMIKMFYQQSIIVLLVFRLLGSHCLGDGWNVQSESRHTLGLTNHDQNLGVKVHVQLIGLRMFHQQGCGQTGPSCFNLEERTEIWWYSTWTCLCLEYRPLQTHVYKWQKPQGVEIPLILPPWKVIWMQVELKSMHISIKVHRHFEIN